MAPNDGERWLAKGIGVTETMPESGLLLERTKPTLGFPPGYKGRNYLRNALVDQKLGKPLQERKPEINQYSKGSKRTLTMTKGWSRTVSLVPIAKTVGKSLHDSPLV
jgi:hypothetical protein